MVHWNGTICDVPRLEPGPRELALPRNEQPRRARLRCHPSDHCTGPPRQSVNPRLPVAVHAIPWAVRPQIDPGATPCTQGLPEPSRQAAGMGADCEANVGSRMRSPPGEGPGWRARAPGSAGVLVGPPAARARART